MAVRLSGVVIAAFVLVSCCCFAFGQQQPGPAEVTVDETAADEAKPPNDEYESYDESDDGVEGQGEAEEGDEGVGSEGEGTQRGSKQLYQILYPLGASPPAYSLFGAQPAPISYNVNDGLTLQQSPQSPVYNQAGQEFFDSSVSQDALLKLLLANSQESLSDSPVSSGIGPGSNSAGPVFPNGAFLVVPETQEEYQTLLQLSKQPSTSFSLVPPKESPVLKAAPVLEAQQQTYVPAPSNPAAVSYDGIKVQQVKQGVPVVPLPASPAFGSPTPSAPVPSDSQARHSIVIPVQAPVVPQQSRTFISGLSSLIPSFSLPSLFPTLNFDPTTSTFTWNNPTLTAWLPANAAATIVDGADAATAATTVGGQMFFKQAKSLLPTTVMGVITGLGTAGQTYNVEVHQSGDVSGGACANVQALLTTGGLTGIIASNQVPVGGTLTLILTVPTTAMTLRGTSSALTRSAVIVDAASNTRVGCGTITGF